MATKKTVKAFSAKELKRAKELLAAKVATMIGRKMEEGDWDFVYCNAKHIPQTNWSNLNIDVMHKGMGVEHKMLCIHNKKSIKDVCGTSLMHPAATRSIRISDTEANPNVVATDVLNQYGELIKNRAQKVMEESGTNAADMRFGWVLWKPSLDEFMYFEEKMAIPKPENYYAEWNETPARGARKATKSLWIYENATGTKRYSVTTTAGIKIQPYFDVPPPNDPHLYYFRVQGVLLDGGLVEVWLTKTTATYLKQLIGSLDTAPLSEAILSFTDTNQKQSGEFVVPSEIAMPVKVTVEAYEHLRSLYENISDEYIFQQFALAYKS